MNFQTSSLFGQERGTCSRHFKLTFNIEAYRSTSDSSVIGMISLAYFAHRISWCIHHTLRAVAQRPSAKQWHADFQSCALMLVVFLKCCRMAFTHLCLRFEILTRCSSNCVLRLAAQI